MKRHQLLDDSGQAAPLALVCMLGLVALAGLVIDGGLLFSSRRSLQSLADGAARAGAMAVDEQTLRGSGGHSVDLDPVAAELAVTEYLRLAGYPGTAETATDPRQVRVSLRKTHRTLLLALVGVRAFETRASSTAEPRSGITESSG